MSCENKGIQNLRLFLIMFYVYINERGFKATVLSQGVILYYKLAKVICLQWCATEKLKYCP